MIEPPDGRAVAAVELDRAVSLVRILLSLVAAAVVGSHGAGEQRLADSRAELLAVVGLVVGSVAAWWLVPLLRENVTGPAKVLVDPFLQLVDTVAFVSLVVVVSTALVDVAWIALVVPIVIAGLRFGPKGIFVAWAVAVGSYLALLWTDAVAHGRELLDGGLIAQRPGALLTIAVAVAVLAGWLQDGWLEQAELRERADARLDRVRIIESAGRAVRSESPPQVLQTCVDSARSLGFLTASQSTETAWLHAVGEGAVLPAEEVPDRPVEGRVELTRWLSLDGRVVYSASVLEVSSQTTISGWDIRPIEPDLAQSLADLVAQATVAHEAAEILLSLREQATRDPLTGLANRRELDRYLADAVSRDGLIALLMIDLDGFKAINDTHGHPIGDQVLTVIAARIDEVVGSDGLAARYGGDEFTIVLTDERAAGASTLAEELLVAMNEPIALPTMDLEAGLSIGVALAEGPVDIDVVRHTADRAVYEAKHAGKGTTRTYVCRREPETSLATSA